MRLDSLKDTFESLDFVNQAQVMRIGLNDNRLDRFLHMIDNQKVDIRKKIDQFGKRATLSKSVDPTKIMKYKKSSG